jgi:phosphomannomutase
MTFVPPQQLVEDWLDWDENSETRQRVAQLCKQAAFSELQRMMAPRLLFGTAGIRGRMGPGFGQLNDLTIIQTTQVLILKCGTGTAYTFQ